MTRSKLFGMGYLVDTRCPKCGCEDTLRHRLWACPDAQVQELRGLAFSDQEVAALATDDTPGAWQGWLHHPGDDAQPAEAGVSSPVYWKAEGIDTFEGDIFIDGSFHPSRFHGMGRSGWSVVAQGPSGERLASAHGMVPLSEPQSSQAGEAMGLLQAVDHLAAPSHLYADYTGLVAAWQESLQIVGKTAHAGTFRRARASQRWHLVKEVAHVKAHTDLSDLERRPLILAMGNTWADEKAKEEVFLHRDFGHPSLADAEAKADLGKRIAIYAGKVLGLWPAVSPPTGEARHRRRRGPRAGSRSEVVQTQGHSWRWKGSWYRCDVCLRRASSHVVSSGHGLPQCKGISMALENVLEGNRNFHSIAAFSHDDGSCILACTSCGAWMESKPKDLLEPCPVACLGAQRSSLKQAARDALGRLSRGQHPRPAKGPGGVLGPALSVPKVGPSRVDE